MENWPLGQKVWKHKRALEVSAKCFSLYHILLGQFGVIAEVPFISVPCKVGEGESGVAERCKSGRPEATHRQSIHCRGPGSLDLATSLTSLLITWTTEDPHLTFTTCGKAWQFSMSGFWSMDRARMRGYAQQRTKSTSL